MAITISGTDGIVGAGFTVDASGVSVTAGVGTFSSVQGSGASLTALPAANLTGTLPALSAASLTSIPAANIVGVCTSGFSKTGGFGKILQVVSGTTTTQVYHTGDGGYDDTGLTATITPSSGTKIYVIVNQQVYTGRNNTGGDSNIDIKVFRDSTEIAYTPMGRSVNQDGLGWVELRGTIGLNYLDTHGADGSTAVTYKTQYSATSGIELYVQRGSSRSTITLIEVAS